MSSLIEFKASVFVSEELERQMVSVSQDLAHRCIMECASRYNFDGLEAIRLLGVSSVNLVRNVKPKSLSLSKSNAEKVSVPKAAFPLPYNGEFNDRNCYALRQNNGLYTQCLGIRNDSSEFCKGCVNQMRKVGGEFPEYGTIQQRMGVGILEYVDPKGRKPIAYTKVMKKYKITEEQVMEEAGKLNIIVNPIHFVAAEETKRGRPKGEEKEPKEKGVKGRPKKEKKLIEIEGDDDLFATLVAQANEEEVEVEVPEVSDEEAKKEKEAAKEAEKAAKEAEKLAKEAEKLAKKEAEKAAKEQAKEAEKAVKEAEKLAKEQAKEAEKLAKEQAKKQKEAEKAAKEAEKAAKEAEKAAKEAAKSSKKVAKEEVAKKEEDDEPDVVKKIEFEGKKYLKSKKTGIVYDYTEYVKNQEQVVVGKWNDATNKIDFAEQTEEEEEEEYDM